MNTVDALNVLGKALCGDSFEVKPGLTDAETILEIAKNYEGGGSGSGGSDIKTVTVTKLPNGSDYCLTDGITWEELADLNNPHPPILLKINELNGMAHFLGSMWAVSLVLYVDNDPTKGVDAIAYSDLSFTAILAEGLPLTGGGDTVLFRKTDDQLIVQIYRGCEPTWRE